MPRGRPPKKQKSETLASSQNSQPEEHSLGQLVVVLGSQWGDEGKGKIVDILSEKFDVCARFNGGDNAGHSIYVGGEKHVFHLLPSGILHPKTVCVIGNGCVVYLPRLEEELDKLTKAGIDYKDRIYISDRAHIVFDYHQEADRLKEKELSKDNKAIGTTGRGIGPAYSDKANRVGIRAGDLRNHEQFRKKFEFALKNIQARYKFDKEYDIDAQFELYKKLAIKFDPLIIDTIPWLHQKYQEKKTFLLEGANAAMLDLDFGTYPYVTSSNPTIGGALTGLGISANKIKEVIGVVKAYTTRVGSGPFPTELTNDLGRNIRIKGNEFGSTTGRERRCGWLDTVVLQYSHMLNGYTSLNLTKVDILSELEEIKIGVAYKYKGEKLPSMPSTLEVLQEVEVEYETFPGWKTDISQVTKYEDLPENCKKYISRIEEIVGVPIRWIGVGNERSAMISKN